MKKTKNKLIRYKNIIRLLRNWPSYFIWKMFPYKKLFIFKIKNLGNIAINRKMLSPFRENIFDRVYFRYIPDKYLKLESPVILDIGANAGFFSLAVFNVFPDAIIHSFEPHPYNFKKLKGFQQKFCQFNWHIYNKAVGETNGEITLSTSTTSDFTTMATSFGSEKFKEKFKCQLISLDSFILEKNIKQIEFAKLDCEGAEYAIIYNLPIDLFKRIKSMCIETHTGQKMEESNNYLNNYIQKQGFKTFAMDNEGYTGYIWAWRED